ncbi:MAG TPA: hypothetical protein VH639_30170 [Bryobacteraceae bacterium]|jgi:hypothetical protein
MDAKTRAIFRQAIREIGRKGGKIGGNRSLKTGTVEERTARARKRFWRPAARLARAARERASAAIRRWA